MKILLIFCLMMASDLILAQSVIVKGTGAGAVRATGAGSVRGYIIPAPTASNFCSGRFTVWSDSTNTVVDNGSGLTWTRDANIDGTKDWTNAIAYCSNLNYAAYEDWRSPSMGEFTRSVWGGTTNGLFYDYPSTNDPALPLGHPFINIQSANYWPSTAVSDEDAAYVYPPDGDTDYISKTNAYYVWPCRGP